MAARPPQATARQLASDVLVDTIVAAFFPRLDFRRRWLSPGRASGIARYIAWRMGSMLVLDQLFMRWAGVRLELEAVPTTPIPPDPRR